MNSGGWGDDFPSRDPATDIFRNPAKYGDLLRGGGVLPPETPAILSRAVDAVRLGNRDVLTAEHEAALFFAEHVLLAHNADHYRVLGLRMQATNSEIRERYHLLMRIFHPDRCGWLRLDGERLAARINLAYQTLRNPALRSSYDLSLRQAQAPIRVPPVFDPPSVRRHRERDSASRQSAVDRFVGSLPSVLRQNFGAFVLGCFGLIGALVVAVAYFSRPPQESLKGRRGEPSIVQGGGNAKPSIHDPLTAAAGRRSTPSNLGRADLAAWMDAGAKAEQVPPESKETRSPKATSPTRALAADPTEGLQKVKEEDAKRALNGSALALDSKPPRDWANTPARPSVVTISKLDHELRTGQPERPSNGGGTPVTPSLPVAPLKPAAVAAAVVSSERQMPLQNGAPGKVGTGVDDLRGVPEDSSRGGVMLPGLPAGTQGMLSTAASNPQNSPPPLQKSSMGLSLDEAQFAARRLADRYKSGDIELFMRLFSTDARAGSGRRADIRKDYDELFQSTRSRHIDLIDFKWVLDRNSGHGSGKYYIRVIGNAEATEKIFAGVLQIDLVKSGDDVLIVGLFHKSAN